MEEKLLKVMYIHGIGGVKSFGLIDALVVKINKSTMYDDREYILFDRVNPKWHVNQMLAISIRFALLD